jgi:outer membrane protein assembly factor BamB
MTMRVATPAQSRRAAIAVASLLACVAAGACSSRFGGSSGMHVDYLIPPSAVAGTPGLVLTIGGTSFSPSSTVSWNGSDLPTVYVSPTELHATVDAIRMAEPGSVEVIVSSAGAAGKAVFVVTNADPTIGSLSPASALATSAGFTLRATGLNFVAGSELVWNGQPLQTTFISRNELRAPIDPAAVDAASFVFVWVRNPAPDGATSGRALFTVLNRVPRVAALNPSSAITGSADLVLEVSGADFVPESQVAWNGKLRPTTFVSTGLLRTTVSASDLLASAEIAVAVVNPPPGGGFSTGLKFPISNPAPSIVSFGPQSAVAGGSGFTLTVTGAGFRPSSVVQWNGAARPTSGTSDGVLHAQISSGDIAAEGTAVISVFNPPLGGGTAHADVSFAVAAVSGPNNPQALTYHQDAARSGRVVFGEPLTFPDSPAWSVDIGSSVSYPLIADGRVFVLSAGTSTGGRGTRLHALDLATGVALRDPVDIPNAFSSWGGTAYAAGRVFVVNFDGVLQSFDGATGTPGWTTALSEVSPGIFDAAPAVFDGIVYVGAADRLFAVDGASGMVRWVSRFVSSTAPFAVAADGVYVSYACEERKLDLLTGSVVWRHVRCSGGGGLTPAYANGLAFVRDIGLGKAAIYDAVTGEQAGSFGLVGPAFPQIPAISPDALFVADSGRLRSFDLQAKTTNWDVGFVDPIASEPILIDGTVFAVSGDGTVHAVDAASGAEVWTASAGARMYVPFYGDSSLPLPGVAAGEGHLLVPAGNLLTAWRLTTR